MKKIFIPVIITLAVLTLLLSTKTKEKVSESETKELHEKHQSSEVVAQQKITSLVNERGGETVIPQIIFRSGNLEFSLLFGDNVEFEIQKLITEDILLLYGHLDIHLKNLDNSTSFLVGKSLVGSKQKIDFLGPGRYLPSEVRELFGYVAELNDKRYIIISDELVQAYRDAKIFSQKHRSAFDNLSQFLDMMNDLENADIPKLNEIFYFDESAAQYKEKFIKEYGGLRYKKPSIFDTKEGHSFSKSFFKKYGSKLITKVYVFDDSGTLKDGSPPFIYDNGKWKLLIYIPGT